MRDKTHMENVEKWAKFIKENPDKWRKIHNEFINAQFEMHNQFVKKLLRTKEGKEKLIKLYNIKNISAYSQLNPHNS